VLQALFRPLLAFACLCLLAPAQAAEQGLCLAGGTYHSVSTVWFNDGNSTARSRVALDGVLFTRPLKQTEKTRWLGLQFQGLTMEVDGKPLSPRFFQVPFAVELDTATGAWLQTHFNGPRRLEDQEQVLALYGTLQGPDSTLIPPEGLTRLERDSLGSATVRYDSPALGTITRRKLAYETLRPGEEGQALTERVAVEQDETTLTELACGFRSAEGRSSTEAFFRGGMTVKTLQRLTVAWDRTLAAPPGLRLAVLGEDPLAWPAVELAWLYPPPPKTPLKDAARFLAALSALDQDQIDDEALKALLFNNDRFLAALQEQFRAGAFSKAFQENLLLRIGQTDAPQARALLVTLAADELLTPAARFGSLMALRYTPSKLEPESLDALLDFSNLSNLSEDGQQLADSALMVLGEVARNTEDGAVTSRLTQALSTAASDQRRLIALNALANAGDETTVPLLGDYLSAGNATVRARAAEALGGIPTAQARALLQGQLQEGNPPVVRAAALQGLGKQSLDASEVAALTRFTAPEEPLTVRRSAIAALAAQKKAHPEVEGTLKGLLVQTSDRESMEIIMRALYQQ